MVSALLLSTVHSGDVRFGMLSIKRSSRASVITFSLMEATEEHPAGALGVSGVTEAKVLPAEADLNEDSQLRTKHVLGRWIPWIMRSGYS